MKRRKCQPPEESEVIVIGGGLFGSSIGYHLARAEKEAVLPDSV